MTKTYPKLRSVRVTYDNGDTITTSMASHLSDDDIYKYFKIGKTFNIGSGANDLLAKVEKVEILDKKEMEEEFAKGGEVSKHDEEIKKLKAVVNSKNIGEGLKAKAQARIDMLEEKASKSMPKSKPASTKQKKKSIKVEVPVKKQKKSSAKTSVPKESKSKKETVFGYAKRTQKSGESWKDAIKRASKELKNGGKPVAKKIKKIERKPKPVAKKIKRTPAKPKPKKTAKVIKRVKYLNGNTKKSVDKTQVAMHPGKRISKSDSTYYEYRANRADLNKTKKL